MNQWWVVPGGDGGELEYREVAMPEVGADQVLIKVGAAGVNRGELIGLPAMRASNPAARPRPSGIEFAGEVAGLGASVSGWNVGDQAIGRGTACHAEYVVVAAEALMPIPTGLSMAEAAAIPNVFVTAHDALVTAAKTKPGDRVLISAGSSGVGTAAIQIAAFLGASEVIATTRSSAKISALTDIGATHVAETNSADWPAALRAEKGEVDVVIDQVGGALFPGMLETMAVGGRYVSVGRNDGASSAIDLDLMSKNRLTLIGVTFRTRSPAEALACSTRFAEDLLPAFDRGDLRPVLDRSFPLDQLPQAHHYMRTDQQFGKIVLAT